MSRSAQQSGTGSGVKAVGATVFVVAMALVVLLVVRARPGPEPFDPRSGQTDGARGLVLTLQEAGADVDDTRTVPGPSDDTRVLVLDDRLDDDQRTELLDFVGAGGVAVVADPTSTLHGGSGTDGGAIVVTGALGENRASVEDELDVRPGDCTIDALTDLRGIFVPDGVLYPVGPSEPQCFTQPVGSTSTDASGHSFVIVREFGDGLIVGLGDNEPFVNRNLRRADNAGLAVALLAPAADADVTFLIGRGASPTVEDVGSGEQTLRDLIPPWVWMGLVLGAIAFVVFSSSRSTRVGRIVTEPVAAPIAGSELVSATGNLMERAGHASRAGWLLLERLHRDLCRAHDVDLDAPLADLDRTVAQRSGTPPGAVENLLRRSAHDAAGLSSLSGEIDRMRRTVFGDDTRDHGRDDTRDDSAGSSRVDPTDERVSTP